MAIIMAPSKNFTWQWGGDCSVKKRPDCLDLSWHDIPPNVKEKLITLSVCRIATADIWQMSSARTPIRLDNCTFRSEYCKCTQRNTKGPCTDLLGNSTGLFPERANKVWWSTNISVARHLAVTGSNSSVGGILLLCKRHSLHRTFPNNPSTD